MDKSSCSGTAENSTIENSSRDLCTADSMSTGWTDEKHSLFLDSIESSFVHQLYSPKYHSNDFLGSRKRTHPCALHENDSTSRQFKVLRRGCWENVMFERVKTRAKIKNDRRPLLSNPWIQHFQSPSNGKAICVTTFVNSSVQAASQKNGGEETDLKNPQHLHCIFAEDLIDSKIEVSDQNFVDDKVKVGQQSSRICKERSWTSTQPNVSLVYDQVVPSEK